MGKKTVVRGINTGNQHLEDSIKGHDPSHLMGNVGSADLNVKIPGPAPDDSTFDQRVMNPPKPHKPHNEAGPPNPKKRGNPFPGMPGAR